MADGRLWAVKSGSLAGGWRPPHHSWNISGRLRLLRIDLSTDSGRTRLSRWPLGCRGYDVAAVRGAHGSPGSKIGLGTTVAIVFVPLQRSRSDSREFPRYLRGTMQCTARYRFDSDSHPVV